MASDKSINLSLLVDKENNRVIFAEAEKDFVDVLCSFLTLPVGTIVRLAHKQSEEQPAVVGCMYNLYKSVENLDARYFQNQVSKKMLLHTRNSSVNECKRLKVNIDDTEYTKYYVCSCSSQKHVSTFVLSQCSCGKIQSETDPDSTVDDKSSNKDDQIFIRREALFLVTDDLHIIPMSIQAIYDLLHKLDVQATETLERKNITINSNEVSLLLKNALYSTETLTNTFLMEPKDCSRHLESTLTRYIYSSVKAETNNAKSLSIKIIYRKSSQIPVHAEAGFDFINFLFSMLTFPLGAVVKLMNESPSLGSVTNLYKSIEQLNADNCIKSDDQKAKLVSPKLALQYGCKDQLLDITEVNHPPWFYNDGGRKYSTNLGTRQIYYGYGYGKAHTVKADLMPLENFVKGPKMFMVTDDLNVSPFSSIASIMLLEQLKIPINDIETRTINIGQKEALQILESSMTSKSVFTTIVRCVTAKIPKQEKC